MKSFKAHERCCRSIFLTVTISACISIGVFFVLQFTGKEKNLKTEISKGNSFLSEKLEDEKCVPVCYSKSCIKQADILLRTIDTSNDPCENIQKFLCGSYEQKIGRNENRSMIFDMTATIMNKVKDIIENTKAEPGSAAEKMKIMYDSCVNLGSSELRGVETFRQLLSNIEIFNWPYLAEDFKFSDSGISKLLGILKAYGEIEYFGLSIESSNKDDIESEEKLVKIFFHEDTFNANPVIQKDVAVDILNYFALESQDIEILLRDYDIVRNALISFGKEFHVYDDLCEENCSATHIDCSSTRNDEWAYVCEMVQIYLNTTSLKHFVTKNEIAVSVYDVLHVKNLILFLNSLSHRSVANFFSLHVLWRDLDKLNFFFRLKMRKYFEHFKSEKRTKMPQRNRWKYCVNWIAENMKIILENELVKSYLIRSNVDEIHEFHQSLLLEVNEAIDQQEWIVPGAKALMKNYISQLECNMVFLRGLLPNDTYVNKFFVMFNPTPTNFYYNTLDYMKSLMYSYSIYESKHDRHVEPNFEANAGTDKDLNMIVLHYGILVPPVYFSDHEKFINRILITSVITHEIGHNVIFLLDEISTIFNITRIVYNERKQCFEDQFSNFKFRFIDENLNGTKYCDENLSDNLGLALTDKMIDELDLSENDFLLPGLPYSLKQLLYMSSRQLFCSKVSRNQEITFKDTDEKHAPEEYRLIASAQNSKRLSKAFNCAEGSYLNPTEKCIFLDSV